MGAGDDTPASLQLVRFFVALPCPHCQSLPCADPLPSRPMHTRCMLPSLVEDCARRDAHNQCIVSLWTWTREKCPSEKSRSVPPLCMSPIFGCLAEYDEGTACLCRTLVLLDRRIRCRDCSLHDCTSSCILEKSVIEQVSNGSMSRKQAHGGSV